MKDELFQQLAASLKEGGAILRGKKKSARSPIPTRPPLEQRFFGYAGDTD